MKDTFEKYNWTKISIEVPFDAAMPFDSVIQALEFCLEQNEPKVALKAIICANIDWDEKGFASELIAAFPDDL